MSEVHRTLRRHWILFAAGAAAVALFFGQTLPALRTNAALSRQERRARERFEDLAREARSLELRWQLWKAGDPLLLERVVRDRYQGGGDPIVPR